MFEFFVQFSLFLLAIVFLLLLLPFSSYLCFSFLRAPHHLTVLTLPLVLFFLVLLLLLCSLDQNTQKNKISFPRKACVFCLGLVPELLPRRNSKRKARREARNKQQPHKRKKETRQKKETKPKGGWGGWRSPPPNPH